MNNETFKNKLLIIAEAGVNHNGSEKIAKKLILEAKKIGADIIKFQIFNTKKLIVENAKKPKYIKENLKLNNQSQFELLKKLELPFSVIKKLNNFCIKNNIEFLLSPFDIDSVKKINQLNLKRIKIPSGEIDNYPMLVEIAKLNLKIILSTGMSSLKEIKNALDILINNGTLKKNITILHCNTDYPTKLNDVNLLAMLQIKKKFNVEIGYSDHTDGIIVPIVATSLGAKIIEKHFTLDKKMNGPDHKASLNPKEFKLMINQLKNVKILMGNGIKFATKSELENIKHVRKSIVAKKNIKKGEIFSALNLTTKRPGFGISPMKWKKIIGRRSSRNYLINENID